MSASADRTIKLWNPLKNWMIKTFSGNHNYSVHDIAM